MSRVIKLEHNLKYRLIESTDFMSRLRLKNESDLPSKIDCINSAKQYVEIYKAIEQRLNEVINENTLYLSFFNKEPWTDRSQLLKNDIRDMRSFLSDDEKTYLIAHDKTYPATQEMLDHIVEADPVTLFAFLSLRCLNDAADGPHLKQCYQQIFLNDNLAGEFYNEMTTQMSDLSQFIDQAILTPAEELQFDKAVNYFCQLQIDLFNEMEEERTVSETKKIDSVSFNYKKGCPYVLFALSAIGATATLAGAAYGTWASFHN